MALKQNSGKKDNIDKNFADDAMMMRFCNRLKLLIDENSQDYHIEIANKNHKYDTMSDIMLEHLDYHAYQQFLGMKEFNENLVIEQNDDNIPN